MVFATKQQGMRFQVLECGTHEDQHHLCYNQGLGINREKSNFVELVHVFENDFYLVSCTQPEQRRTLSP